MDTSLTCAMNGPADKDLIHENNFCSVDLSFIEIFMLFKCTFSPNLNRDAYVAEITKYVLK